MSFTEKILLFLLVTLTTSVAVEGCVGYRSCDVRRGKILPEAIRTQFDEHGFRRYITYCLNRELSSSTHWETILDFTFIDSDWFKSLENQNCSLSASELWMKVINDYLVPDGPLYEPIIVCSVEFSSYNESYRKSLMEEDSLAQTAAEDKTVTGSIWQCVQDSEIFPASRHIFLPSLVEFLQQNVNCERWIESSNYVNHLKRMNPSGSDKVFPTEAQCIVALAEPESLLRQAVCDCIQY